MASSAAIPLRIAMVHLSDFRLDSRIQRQARALAERGDEVDLVCLGERDELRVGDGVIRVHPVRCVKPSGGIGSYLRGYSTFLVGAFARVAALALRRRFDLVEVHNMPDFLTVSAVVPRLQGTPVILNLHDTLPELFATKFSVPYARVTRLLELEERLSARLADSLVTVTEGARRRLEARGLGGAPIVVVMNSPDEGAFGPRCQPAPVPADGAVRLLYHGGTAPRFGVETLIRAFATLRETAPRATLRVCGTGENLEQLRALAQSIAPDRIEVAGPVPFSDIPGELRPAHIGIVPTLHDQFTELLLPVKLLEYIHMGLPVVASRLPGITEYFSQDDLRLFKPGDADDLAGAVRDVLSAGDDALTRASHASRKLEQISWDRQRERYLSLVDGLVRQARAGRLALA